MHPPSGLMLSLSRNVRLSVRVFVRVFDDFVLQNMAETTLPDGLEPSGGRAYR